MLRRWTSGVLALIAAVVLVAGCGKPEDKAKDSTAKEKGTPVAEQKAKENDGWWCKEHGVPEGECSMCSDKVAKACKDKGDWCKEHERAESQCFICHPEHWEKYRAAYKARYGKEPPLPKDNMPTKKEAKE